MQTIEERDQILVFAWIAFGGGDLELYPIRHPCLLR
jgi:hypothetical protein